MFYILIQNIQSIHWKFENLNKQSGFYLESENKANIFTIYSRTCTCLGRLSSTGSTFFTGDASGVELTLHFLLDRPWSSALCDSKSECCSNFMSQMLQVWSSSELFHIPGLFIFFGENPDDRNRDHYIGEIYNNKNKYMRGNWEEMSCMRILNKWKEIFKLGW